MYRVGRKAADTDSSPVLTPVQAARVRVRIVHLTIRVQRDLARIEAGHVRRTPEEIRRCGGRDWRAKAARAEERLRREAEGGEV
jgi:hypothetical protein